MFEMKHALLCKGECESHKAAENETGLWKNMLTAASTAIRPGHAEKGLH